jgi:hypothetical protein
MPDEVITPPSTTATPPATTTTPAVTPPAVTPPARTAARPPSDPNAEPAWKQERAKGEARRILRQFGIKVGKNDDLAALAADYQGKREKRKAELEDLRAKLPAAEAKAAAAATVLKLYAEQSLGKLPEAAQTAIKALAGDDPVKILEHVALAAAVGASVTTTATAAKPPVPPGATTTAAGGAPPPATANATDHKLIYTKLQETNPLSAAAYGLRHEREIFADTTA